MSARALRLIRDEVGSQAEEDSVWLGWLLSHLDERWRPGEWDRELWLFTGDADNDRTGTWRCHTPGCVVATDRANGLCEGCRRERTRPTVHGERAGGPLATRATGAEQTCSVPGCGSEQSCRGLCHRHEGAWRQSGSEALPDFIARARPLDRLADCLVVGCDREQSTSRGLCRFHTNRLRAERQLRSLTADELRTVDFGVIELEWLRQVIKSWGKDTRPYVQKLRQALLACRIASQALVAGGASDPTRLGPGDFAHIITAITGHHRADGTLYSAKHRNQLVRVFAEVIDHGRSTGLMAQIPDPFGRGRYRPVVEDPNEDELGKALPQSVIRQLDAHIDLLGPRGRAGSIGAADLQAMHQAAYRLLRDTGRRPGEVVSLKLGCVETIDGQANLVYDNHKAGRLRRRVPITTDTADAVLVWERRRVKLNDPAVTRGWMFPSPMLRARQSVGHLSSAAIGKAFREWMARIDIIHSDTIGPDGTPLPYDKSFVVPYALRHSWAQRHADAGVPVDVLRELMDHRSVQTTMGYYHISLHRKQQAIRAVGSLAVDARGNPAPFTSPVAWERASVSVPFGNCTEPSNVKAGGGSCPIRFQCAGCGFYRPDPSYLTAIEEHTASLRADRETARAIGAADYVITNLTAQIDTFAQVAERMGHQLGELGADERAEVEEASRLLRRARAARRIPVVAVTTIQAR